MSDNFKKGRLRGERGHVPRIKACQFFCGLAVINGPSFKREAHRVNPVVNACDDFIVNFFSPGWHVRAVILLLQSPRSLLANKFYSIPSFFLGKMRIVFNGRHIMIARVSQAVSSSFQSMRAISMVNEWFKRGDCRQLSAQRRSLD